MNGHAGRQQRRGTMVRPSSGNAEAPIAERGHIRAGTGALLLIAAIWMSSMFPDGQGGSAGEPGQSSHRL
jgi:hypothetical protein